MKNKKLVHFSLTLVTIIVAVMIILLPFGSYSFYSSEIDKDTVKPVLENAVEFDRVAGPVSITDGNNLVLTFPIAPEAGSLVVVGISQWDNPNGIISVTDNQGNIYVAATDNPFDSNRGRNTIYYAENVVSNGVFGITVHIPNGVDSQAVAASFTGVSASDSLLDTSTADSPTFINSAQTGVAGSEDNALYFAVFSETSTSSITSLVNEGTSFSNMGPAAPIGVVYFTGSGDQNINWNLGGYTQWGASLAVFKESTGVDAIIPVYSNNNVNNTQVELSTSFGLTVNDDTALEDNGYYIFSTNNSGVWVNDSAVNFTSTPQGINVVKVLTNVEGTSVGYRWYLYDNMSNEALTETFSLTTNTPDTISPIYSNNDVDNIQAGLSSVFSLTVNDDIALENNGYYIFSTNNTGTWVNDSAVNFTSMPQTINTVKTLNGGVGISIGYRWHLYDNEGNSVVTDTFEIVTSPDVTAPVHSNNNVNNTQVGLSTSFGLTVNDDTALEDNGYYIFSTNNTGTWVNDSAVNFSGTPSQTSASKIITNIEGTSVGYRWYLYDNAGNEVATNVFSLITTGADTPSLGSGTLNDPYQITNWFQLSEISNRLTSYYILMNDIDYSSQGYVDYASSTANNGAGWDPINNFRGHFNGQGHVIRDLYIDRPATDSVGLFGQFGSEGVIENLGVENANVVGDEAVGILVGENYPYLYGTIRNSYTSGNVSGNTGIGGIIGINYYSDVLSSYSSASVNGNNNVGGLVGENYAGFVDDSYSIGSVSGSSDYGGLIGYGFFDTVTNSYWDSEASGVSSSDGGSARTTSQMHQIGTFSAWDISDINNYTNQVWKIDDGISYPILEWENYSPASVTFNDFISPSYSNNLVNNTQVELSTSFGLTLNDNVALHPNGYYIFSTNNSGVWVNDSAVNFTSTPQGINVVKVLTNVEGTSVGYRWYLYDNASNEIVTILYNFITTVPDNTPPVFISIPSNEVLSYGNSLSVGFSAIDDVAISNYFVNDTKFGIDLSGLLSNVNVLEVGNYSLTILVNDSSNNFNSTEYLVTVTTGSLQGSLSGTASITYGTSGDVTGTESNSIDDDVTYILYRDGVQVSNPDTSVLAVGSYDYVYNSTGGNNWSSNSSIDTFTLTVNGVPIDEVSPTYSNNNSNNTIVNLSTNFSLDVNDDTALHPNGYYIFSTNNSGTWVNDSSVNFTSTPQSIYSIQNLNDTEGISIGYRWYLYDDASNENITNIFSLITTNTSLISPSSAIIANHTAVDSFDSGDIPSCWIEEVKTMHHMHPGASHSEALPYGLEDLEEINSTYAYTNSPSSTEHWVIKNLYPLGGTGEFYCDYCRSEDIWTSYSAINATIESIQQSINDGDDPNTFEWGWSWDMSVGDPSLIDPVYQVRWYGESIGGPNGSLPWGIDEGDSILTNNSLSLQNYYAAMVKIQEAYPEMIVIYSTGVVDDGGTGYNVGEKGYQRYLRNQDIRSHAISNNLTLFDIADIITYNDEGVAGFDIWTDYGGNIQEFPLIHSDNYNGEYIGHIGDVGALRLAKAHWWLMARIAGWNGLPDGEGANTCI